MQRSILDQIQEQYESNTPVVVLQLYTPAYATSPTEHGYRAGLRNMDDYLIETSECAYKDIDALRKKYNPNLHYILDDDSVSEADWLAAASLYNSAPRVLTCDLVDAIDFITTALRTSGKCDVMIDGARWEVTR